MTNITPTRFYRYVIRDYGESYLLNVKVALEEYNLHKETPKGYWIGYGSLSGLIGKSIWVSKTSKKRFAYPSKQEALNNFILRTQRRLNILSYQAKVCEYAIGDAKQLMDEIKFTNSL